MYEMYPDTWASDRVRAQSVLPVRPRRRARKPRSVIPAPIAGLVRPAAEPSAA